MSSRMTNHDFFFLKGEEEEENEELFSMSDYNSPPEAESYRYSFINKQEISLGPAAKSTRNVSGTLPRFGETSNSPPETFIVPLSGILQKNKRKNTTSATSHKKRNMITLSTQEERFKRAFYGTCGMKLFDKKYVQLLHNTVCNQLSIPKVTREENRSIKKYFRNRLEHSQQIIDAVSDYVRAYPQIIDFVTQPVIRRR